MSLVRDGRASHVQKYCGWVAVGPSTFICFFGCPPPWRAFTPPPSAHVDTQPSGVPGPMYAHRKRARCVLPPARVQTFISADNLVSNSESVKPSSSTRCDSLRKSLHKGLLRLVRVSMRCAGSGLNTTTSERCYQCSH